MIEGAAEGAGLGVQFLKHLSRTRLLLHLVDVAPIDGSDPAENFRLIEKEVEKYSDGIAAKDRWLVFTKIDLLSRDQLSGIIEGVLAGIDHEGPTYHISAIAAVGTEDLCNSIQAYLREIEQADREDSDLQIRQEVHEYSLSMREKRRTRRQQNKPVDEAGDDINEHVHGEPRSLNP